VRVSAGRPGATEGDKAPQPSYKASAMTRTTRAAGSFAIFFSISIAAVACGGAAGPPPTMQGREGMLSKTAIAQKCEEAAKGHDRPFVVEWDATDLASFEAKAGRDTIFVKYQGCSLDVLYGCSDPNVAGQFGAYGAPQFTSGTVQGFDMKNQGELYAKLPLGAASLSAKVAAGEELHLKYFVSGVATSSRDAIYRADIDKIAACKGATHFVWAYNLGAFELGSAENNSAEGKGGIGNIGAGGSRTHESSSLANGGSLTSCTTNDQRACRVPIRLALRSVTDGENPTKSAGGQTFVVGGAKMTVAQMGEKNYFDSTPVGQASKMIDEANKKNMAGDGAACVDLLDKAVNLDPSRAQQIGWTHATCQMKSGRCDVGKTEFRQVFVARDPERRKTDAELDAEVQQQANNNCPSSTATTPAEFIIRAGHEMTAAAAAKDGARCHSLFDGIEKKIGQLDRTKREDMTAQGPGTIAMDQAASCVAETEGCDKGLDLWRRSYRIKLRGDKIAERASVESWGTMIKLGSVKCK